MNIKTLADLKKEVRKDVELDQINLDLDALNLAKKYNKYLELYYSLLSDAEDLKIKRDMVYLQRWKFYQGKLPSEHYLDEPLNDVISKSDLGIYLKADKQLSDIDKKLATIKHICNYTEKILEQIKNMGFQIKTAVEWRKFQSGN